jgi:lysophospholipase L1-like esterase
VFSRIRERAAAGKLGDVVVIHTGTNGVIVRSELIDTLKFLDDRSRVVLVTVKADRPWVDGNNRVLRSVFEQFEGTNVRLADWATLSRGNREWFYSDGIHTKSAGSAKYAELIKSAMSD